MSEKRTKMIGVMIPPSLEESIRKLAYEKRVTVSTFAYEAILDHVLKDLSDRSKNGNHESS